MVKINLSPSKVALLFFDLSKGRIYGFSVPRKINNYPIELCDEDYKILNDWQLTDSINNTFKNKNAFLTKKM